MHYLNEAHIFFFLVQIFILLGSARILGEACAKIKVPSLTAELIVGVVLGPTLLGRYAPDIYTQLFPHNLIQQNMFETVAWLGILFFLLQTGLEMDFSSAWRQRGDALTISISDIIIPMIIALIPCLFLPAVYMGGVDKPLLFALFIATVMTISALPVTARILQDLHLYKTEVGFLIMSALSVNDIIGWVVFTLVLGFITQTDINFMRIFVVVGSTIGFTIFCLTIGRWLSNFAINSFKKMKLPETSSSLTFIVLLGMICGAATLKIGIHALFGFFIAGIMAGEARQLSEKTRNVISQIVHAFFVPLFFVNVGLKIDFLKNFDILLVLFIFFIGVFGRFLGAWVGVTFTKQSRTNRYLISIAHTPGGEMQIVVGMLALEYGLITETVFVAIVCGAVFSSILTGPWMLWALRRRKIVSILEYFVRKNIGEELKATTCNEAIRELTQKAVEYEHSFHEDELYDAVIKREEEMGTAVEGSIAIPHARIRGLVRPIILFARSKQGIEWNSPDGKLTHFIFLIVTPDPDDGVQLQILRSLAQEMRDDTLRKKLYSIEETTKIWDIFYQKFTSHHIQRT